MNKNFFYGDFRDLDTIKSILLKSDQVLAIIAKYNLDLLDHEVRPEDLEDVIAMLPEGSHIDSKGQAIIGTPKARTQIELSKDSSTMDHGSTDSITVTTNAPGYTVDSRDLSVATVVKNGGSFTIRAVGEGKTKIRIKAQAHDHDVMVKYINVVVGKPKEKLPTPLTVSTDHDRVYITSTCEFEVFTEADSITIESSNPDIITAAPKGDSDLAKTVVVTAKSVVDKAVISVTAKVDGKYPVTKSVVIEVIKPKMKIQPLNPLVIKAGESLPINIELIDAVDYSFVNKRAAVVTFNRDTSNLEAKEVVTEGTQYPYSYVEFTPKVTINGSVITGDVIYCEIKTVSNPFTTLSFSPTNPSMWEGNSATVTITTDANDFTYVPLDDKLNITRQGNTLTLQSTRGIYGQSQIQLRAKREGCREIISTMNVTIKDHSRMEFIPADFAPIMKRGGAAATYTIHHNVNRLQFSSNNSNVNVSAVHGEGVGSLSLTPTTTGWCNVTIYGTKNGSFEATQKFVCQVLDEEPRFNLDPLVISIPSVGDTATLNIDCNWMGNMFIRPNNTNVATTSNISNNRTTVTGTGKGVTYIRLWKQHQEHKTRLVKVIVGRPSVLVDNSAAPLWTRGSGARVQHNDATFLNGADDYEAIVEDTDQLEYNKESRTITTKGTLVSGQLYRIKLVPKMGDYLQDEELCSYLIIKGQ